MKNLEKNQYENLFHQLAEFPATDLPVISAYLDMRPQATGRNPGIRSGEIVLKDRLHEIEKTYLPRGDDLDSFRDDREKIENFVEETMSPATSGLIIFACSAKDLWETVEVGAVLDNEVMAGSVPSLFQFAKMSGAHHTAVVAVVDTNTARFFVTNFGKLAEAGGPDDPNNDLYNKTSGGGWSQARYQRIVENNRDQFSKEAAENLDELIKAVDAKSLIIAGDEIATTLLKDNLSHRANEILHPEILRIDEKAPKLEIKGEIKDILDEIEKDSDRSIVEKLISTTRGNGLAVTGFDATKRALENGQVDTLIIDNEPSSIAKDQRNEMLRLASATGAIIETVDSDEKLNAMEGVGCLLRFKYQEPDPSAKSASQ